jgi:NADP-dependent alcohol dehydrogenase
LLKKKNRLHPGCRWWIVIDGVKFLALLILKETNRNFTKRILKKCVPFGTVLTLPATGSEMNSGAVVILNQRKTCF